MICDLRCRKYALKSPVWVTGWERTVHKAFGRDINHDKPSVPTLNTVIDDSFGQVSRALGRKDSGPAAFDLYL